LFLIILVGLGLRVFHLGSLSLWIDESFTRYYSESTLSYLWTTGFALETNPPLYYSIMHGWMLLFGPSEFALRSFSALASVLVIPLVYAIGRELQNRTVGIVAAFLLAVEPVNILYGQEARTYAIQEVAVAVTLLGLVRFLFRAGSRSGLKAYGLGAIVAIYFHDTALIFVVACNLAVITAGWLDRSLISPRDLVRWLGANTLVALAALPSFLNVWHQVSSDNLDWIPPLTFHRCLDVMASVLGGRAMIDLHFHYVHYTSILLMAVIVCNLCLQRTLDRRSVAVLVLIPLFFGVMLVLYSLHKPILMDRVLLWTWIPYSLLLAHVLIRGTNWRMSVAALTTLVFAIGLYALYFAPYPVKENWRGLVQKNQMQFAKAEVIAVSTTAPVSCLVYYLPFSVPHVFYWRDYRPIAPGFVRTFIDDKFRIPTTETADLLRDIRAGRRVCLVLSDQDQQDPAPSPLALLPPPTYRFDDDFPGGIHILAWSLTRVSDAGRQVTRTETTSTGDGTFDSLGN